MLPRAILRLRAMLKRWTEVLTLLCPKNRSGEVRKQTFCEDMVHAAKTLPWSLIGTSCIESTSFACRSQEHYWSTIFVVLATSRLLFVCTGFGQYLGASWPILL